MNKKLNTALFIIAATVVNILIMFILMVLGFVLLAKLLPNASPGLAQGLSLLIFVLAMVGSFFIYNKIIKLITKKIDMEKLGKFGKIIIVEKSQILN